jgi:hyperosmotically inducible periplasmic protein
MKRFLFTFVLGVAAGACGHWYFTQDQGRAQLEEVRTNASRIGGIVKSKASEGYEDVKDEVTRTGTVVRDKAKDAGEAMMNAATDTRITAAVKTRLVSESGLAGLSISVATANGVVTLSGDVTDVAQVSKAVETALKVDGVTRVVSKLQVTAQKPR